MLKTKTKWKAGIAAPSSWFEEYKLEPALNWLKQFAEQHGRPLLYTEQVLINGQYSKQQQTLAYGPPAFQQEITQRIAQGQRLWD